MANLGPWSQCKRNKSLDNWEDAVDQYLEEKRGTEFLNGSAVVPGVYRPELMVRDQYHFARGLHRKADTDINSHEESNDTGDIAVQTGPIWSEEIFACQKVPSKKSKTSNETPGIALLHDIHAKAEKMKRSTPQYSPYSAEDVSDGADETSGKVEEDHQNQEMTSKKIYRYVMHISYYLRLGLMLEASF